MSWTSYCQAVFLFTCIMGSFEVALPRIHGQEKEVQDKDTQEHRSANLVFADSFRDVLSDRWKWLRPQPARWCIRQGGLEIRVWPGFADTVENALLYEISDRGTDKWSFEVTVENLSPLKQQWEQAGLTWYSDDRPVFKLVKELVDGQIMIIPGNHLIADVPVQLRIDVVGSQLQAWYRTELDGPYLEAGSAQLPNAENEKISIQCYHGPPDAEHWIRFTNFRVHRENSSSD